MAAELAVTIYNQNFAVVRDKVALVLASGTNLVRFADATAFVEPSSVILRDPSNAHQFQVLEQNYRGDPVSQEMMLALNEGKMIDFEILSTEGNQTRRETIPGLVVRSGTVQTYSAYSQYSSPAILPIIEMKGKLRFGLPGQPLFSSLADNTVLKPTLQWLIRSEGASSFDAEVSYVTGEMRWEADYNLLLTERGNEFDLVGWITMDNESGKTFQNARVKLMAGDVNKIQSAVRLRAAYLGGGGGGAAQAPPVTEKSFDEYHLYTLENATTLLDHEKKQVEFVRAQGVKSALIYVYDGARGFEQRWTPEVLHTEAEYGTLSNTKIWVVREFTNSIVNQLGIPLPKGRLRVYRRDTGAQMEFTGENVIDHTPRDELVRLTTGNAFDLVGERKRTDFKIDLGSGVERGIDPATGLPIPASGGGPPRRPYLDESFEITLRNHKKEAVEIQVVEHLYRWVNWDISKKSQTFQKRDAQTIEFLVRLEPDQQQEVGYTVHYTW
jgi:hypothetical protein